ncbi:hypothetical protein QYF61_026803 [Mycteria americana]|uniref:Envelope protein n=1 Tax=Mycteria americana TaxID=33587 RepID=A0AAN7NWP6_MYCAM|nr:hypothetical protein QYF61_026803 [Mycteria americana]
MILLLIIGIVLPVVMSLHKIEPRENMWVTWANKTGQQVFCLSLASATEPFRMCLIGVPGFKANEFSSFAKQNCSQATNVSGCSATLINNLNVTLLWDPQELSLLESMRIGNSSKNWTQTCFIFGGPAFTGTNYYRKFNWTEWTNVTSKEDRYSDYYNPAGYCGNQAALGAETKGGVPIWNNGTPKALPPDVFLICGDRAWQGVPQNVFGGPCYLGKLTLLAPDQNWWENITNKTIGTEHRTKREVTGLPPDCDDKLTLLKRVFLSLFIPGGAAGRALKQVGQLACWAEKQANVTTQVIETLLEDQNSLRHAILQNRAAIDFLLLAQGHGCEDFEGMCCMNLSDHSESIHKQLQWLKEHVNKIRQNQGFFDEWLTSLFGPLPSWLKGLLAEGLRLLIILVIISLCFCVACSCVKKAFITMINHAWIAQKQEGGIVEEWFSDKGHDLIDKYLGTHHSLPRNRGIRRETAFLKKVCVKTEGVTEKTTRRGAMLDLVLTNKEGLVGNVKLKGSLDCRDHEMVPFKILRAPRRVRSKLTTLDFRRADFGLFRDLLGRVPWDKALEGRGAQESWLMFKDHLLQAQE